jgi:hypothetical protein
MLPTYYLTPDGYCFAETHDPEPDPSYRTITAWPYRYVSYEDAPAVQEALARGETPRVPPYDGPRCPPLPHPIPDRDEADDDGRFVSFNPLAVPPAGTLLDAPLRMGKPKPRPIPPPAPDYQPTAAVGPTEPILLDRYDDRLAHDVASLMRRMGSTDA